MDSIRTSKSQLVSATAAGVANVLSRPPCRAGLRLRPEEELSGLLRLTYRQTREVLAELEQQGLVARRRGSGTYLRRVPHETSTAAEKLPQWFNALDPRDLLVSPDAQSHHARKRERSLRPHASQRRLHLELWSDLHCTSAENQLLLAGLTRRVGQLGHELTIHSLVERRDVPLPRAEVARQLQESHADGFIVVDRWADLFVEALGRRSVPMIYFRTGAGVVRHEPLISYDTAEAVERAVRLLVGSGYQNIALLDLQDEAHPNEPMTQAYKRAMTQAGLPYRAVESSPAQLNAALRAFRRLMALPQQPEAIYVADDHLLAGVAEGMSAAGLRPGADLGIITLSNVGVPLPDGHAWSRLEFNPELLGQRLAEELVRRLEQADAVQATMSLHASWQPGETHLAQRTTELVQA